MIRVPVDSSTLLSVAYSRDRLVLEVEFRSHIVYRYFDVPPEIYHALLASDSKGKYFNAYIRNCFIYNQLSAASTVG